MISRNICPACGSKEWKGTIDDSTNECQRCDHKYDVSNIPDHQVKMETFTVNTNINEVIPIHLITNLDEMHTPYMTMVYQLNNAFNSIDSPMKSGLTAYGIAVRMTDYLTENGYILLNTKNNI